MSSSLETNMYVISVALLEKYPVIHLQIDKKAMHKVGMVQRVQNEVKIHCQLKHPSILEVRIMFFVARTVYVTCCVVYKMHFIFFNVLCSSFITILKIATMYT